MGRFLLLIILLFGISAGIIFMAQSDINTVEVTLRGYVTLEKESNFEGVKVEVIRTIHRVFKKEPKRRITTDKSGMYCLEKVKVSEGLIGDIFIRWLEGKDRSIPYLKLRISKPGYLPVDVLIFKFTPTIYIPQIELDRKDIRHKLNIFLYNTPDMKIIKNVTPYKFCPTHNYFLFYPKYYNLTVETLLREAGGSVTVELQLIFTPLYITWEKELEKLTPKLARIIKSFIPKAQAIETELPSTMELNNVICSPDLIRKLNKLISDSQIQQIRVIDISFKKYHAGEGL
jgi:hypothetical protein